MRGVSLVVDEVEALMMMRRSEEMTAKRVTFASAGSRPRTDTDFSVTDEVSLFFASCKADDVSTVQRILNEDVSVLNQTRKGTMAIHVAARAGSDRSLQAILNADPDSTLRRDKAGFSAFARAAEAGKVSSMKLLLNARPNSVHDRDVSMFTPLHRTAGNCHVEACRLLLDSGASVNDVDHKTKETPLFHACRSGCAGTVQVLLERGADVNSFNDSYSTSLFVSIHSFGEKIGQSDKVLDVLLSHRAKIDLQNNFCQTPLSLAVEFDCPEAVVKLLKAGANPEFAAYNRLSPLRDVLINNKVEMIKAFEMGLGKSAVVDKLCELSSAVDPNYILGKHVHVLGYGDGFCVEVFRPILGLFGTLTHTIRFSETGKEENLILNRAGVPGVAFYLIPDQNFEKPLKLSSSPYNEDDSF